MFTFGTLFSGGGGFDLGLMAAGLSHSWGVEIEPAIAAVYRQNIGDCINESVLDVDPGQLAKVDWLHASPPCLNFSQAKTNRAEMEIDSALANKICEFISAIQPTYFTLENVEGYKRSRSLQSIVNHLYSLGYWADWQILNAADFGVPQTRKRLILRATKGFLPPLPAPVKWVGWHEAIADLIPDMPSTEFAPWQIDKLPELKESTLLGKNGFGEAPDMFSPKSPSMTVISSSGGRHRAFIVDGKPNDRGSSVTVKQENEPCFAVTSSASKQASRAFIVHGTEMRAEVTRTREEPVFTVTSSFCKGFPKAWMDQGRVVAMTPRALARFQSFPDSYALPESKTLACKILGNAVPPLLAQRIAESFIGG